jgi:pyridoxine 5-phosphate synthase
MGATVEMAKIALQVRPDQVTLVPERPQELTTEGGLDVVLQANAVKDFIRQIRDSGIRVSLFVDADLDQVRKAKTVGAEAIEINTGSYTTAIGAARDDLLRRVAEAASMGRRHGLEVLAGHGLNYINVRPIVAISEIAELNIGHSIVARASLVGMERAVREMVALLQP